MASIRSASARRCGIVAAMLGASCLGTAAQAQTAAPAVAPSESNEARTLSQDIIVTAQRRETRLQDTPIAVSAIAGDTLLRERIIGINEVALRVPSITFQRVNSSEAFISIRGTTIGNDSPGIDQGVSVFIDDVPTTGFADNNPALYDLQSVEVLRGPQGTLFGRNVTGGAVLLRTLAPSFTPSGRATLTYGSDNLAELQAYATGPIIADKLAVKIATEVRHRDDFLTNATLHDKTNGDDLGSVRGQLLWTPTDTLKILVGGDYLDDQSPGKAQWIIGSFQPSQFPTLNYTPDATNQGSNARTDRKVGGALARIDATLPFATLTSVTGYRDVKERIHYSTSGDPFNSILTDDIQRDSQVSEELRLTSPANQRFTWVAGVFFLRADRLKDESRSFAAVPGTRLNFLANLGVPSLARFKTPYVSETDQSITLDSAAVFGEATYAFSDALKFTAGGRYSHERKRGHTEISDTSVQNPALSTGEYAASFNAFTPKALLSFQPSRNFLAYVSATNGFESGGFDVNGTSVAALRSAYRPEHVWSYETGIKSSFFQRRLQLNLSGYDAEYKDLQTRNFDPLSGNIIAGNAAKARVYGVEVEANADPVDWLSLGATYSYTHARYRDYVLPNQGGPATDYSGNRIPFVPSDLLNVRAEIHEDVRWGGSIRVGGDVTFRSSVQFNDANAAPANIVDRSRYRGVTNVHATWASRNDRIEVTLFGKNVTNTQSVITAADLSNFYDTFAEFNAGNTVFIVNYTDPRVIGISLTGRF